MKTDISQPQTLFITHILHLRKVPVRNWIQTTFYRFYCIEIQASEDKIPNK